MYCAIGFLGWLGNGWIRCRVTLQIGFISARMPVLSQMQSKIELARPIHTY
jgi:hypothetical protein